MDADDSDSNEHDYHFELEAVADDGDAMDDTHSNESDDGEEQPFDITLAASHSYMGVGLVAVGGRRVLEAGWRGRLPVLAHHGCVFPGETVPMLLTHSRDIQMFHEALEKDKLFGLLCPNASGTSLSGYGVVCEVYEAGEERTAPLSFKARATQRFRTIASRQDLSTHAFTRLRMCSVRILGEARACDALAARLHSLDARRDTARVCVRDMEAALTPWPRFLYDMFDYERMRNTIQQYFKPLALEVPTEVVSLSFWAASNLALRAADRLQLLVADHALLRLHIVCQLIHKQGVLCCASCATEIASQEHMFAMSSDGVHSNYTNPGGFLHDVVTVSSALGAMLSGSASLQYSWFPGYSWTIALCATCRAHVGWKFKRTRRSLRPASFYGLCRNQVVLRDADAREVSDARAARDASDVSDARDSDASDASIWHPS